MSTHNPRDHKNLSATEQPDGWPKDCDTETTPTCPTQLLAERDKIIHKLAGQYARNERVRIVARQVDAYILASLESALAFAHATSERVLPH